jgi:hypothetical protein
MKTSEQRAPFPRNAASLKCNVHTFQIIGATGMNSDHLSVVRFLDALVLKCWVVKQKDGGAGEAGVGIDVVFNVICIDSNDLACVNGDVPRISKTCPYLVRRKESAIGLVGIRLSGSVNGHRHFESHNLRWRKRRSG